MRIQMASWVARLSEKALWPHIMCDDPATGGYSTRDEGVSKPGWPEGKLEGYVQVSQNSTSDSHTSRQCCIEEGFKRFFLETLIRNRGKN